ncbi:MAG: alpha/beta hydrolase [Candidatus Izemoplasma sp.]
MKKEFILIDPYENELHTYLWTTTLKKPKGIVQIIHGESEHLTRYHDFALYLNSQGFHVIGNDHLGHGKTAETNEYIFFDANMGFHKVYEGVKTVRDYIEEKYPKLKVIMFGHSMGSFIGRYTVINDQKRYDLAIFSGSAHFFRPKIKFLQWISTLLIKRKGPKYISKFLIGRTSDVPVKSMRRNGLINLPKEWLSHDKAVQDYYETSEMCGMPFTVSAHRDLFEMILEMMDIKKIRESASSMPIFFVSGEEDALGDYGEGIKKLYRLYSKAGYSNLKFRIFVNCRHEVVNEVEKDRIYESISEWIFKYL